MTLGVCPLPLTCVVLLACKASPALAAQDRDAPLPAREWEVSAEPLLVIGALESGPEASLYQVNGAVRLSDGRVVVANGGSSQLVVFSPERGHLGSIGREGQGPGEFQRLTNLQRGPNDSLFAFDAGMQRLTVFSAGGELERTAAFHLSSDLVGGGPLVSVMRLADGVWLGRERTTMSRGPPGEFVRDTIGIGPLDGTLDGFQPFVHLPAQIVTTILWRGRQGWRSPAFSPRVVHAIWGRCAFVSTTEDRSISVFTSARERMTTLQGPGSLRSITQEHIDSWIEFNLNSGVVPESEKEEARRRLARYARLPALPYYRHIVTDQWGHIWLQEYSPPDGLGRRWYVLSQTGRLLSEVVKPKRMRVFEIGEDGVLARTLGELGEEMVELFPLTQRPSDPAPPLAECEPRLAPGGEGYRTRPRLVRRISVDSIRASARFDVDRVGR